MTLVLTVNGPETIWMLTDRRLSYDGRPPKEDACKMMTLEADDGVALLGYAGLGATAKGTEPSTWMSNVLRGHRLPIEQCLQVLVDAFQHEFPPHLLRLPRRFGLSHSIVVPAFVSNEVKLFSIDMAFPNDGGTPMFRWTRHTVGAPEGLKVRTARFGIAGSGSAYLERHRHWIRKLLRIVRACDELKVSPRAVADLMADINNEVHLNTPGNSVGPRSIVVWRHKSTGKHRDGGGLQYYHGESPESHCPMLPTIGRGTDWKAVTKTLFDSLNYGPDGTSTPLNNDALNEKLAQLPSQSDRRLI